ncbi:hypothetical protein BTBSAS_150049 [Brochothrix thermosphacta]|uniref:Uncharacterized protein n=1 Tax=Brochothrix thermosphacta TaxID=2756 RepID=A0A2X0R0B8_BROTH|nr:hypothetical protein BTBSAS_150049 [Brochothrix thermosphacta]
MTYFTFFGKQRYLTLTPIKKKHQPIADASKLLLLIKNMWTTTHILHIILWCSHLFRSTATGFFLFNQL